ncbi:MAG TPA: outer membrane beta-barrel protein, partial [Solirubrobacterales bacterium]
MRRLFSSVLILGALALSALPAAAQMSRSGGSMFRNLYVGAGPSFATGDAADVLETGFNLTFGWRQGISNSPLSVRTELSWFRFGAKDIDADADDFAFMVNLQAGSTSREAKIRPYLIGGVGIHYIDIESGAFSSYSSEFGMNGGGGLEIGAGQIALFA